MTAERYAGVGRWVSIGPSLITYGLGSTGRVTTISIHPTRPTTIYVGGRSGNPSGAGGSGVWKTTDGGATWRPVSDELPNLKIGALALEPGRPSNVYAATIDRANRGAGLYRSDDAGTTWSLVVDDARLNGRTLLIDPTDPQRMYMANTDGVYRSLDGGSIWTTVLDPGAANVTDLEIDLAAPLRLYAGLSHETSAVASGIFASVDGGNTWTKLVGCAGAQLPTSIAGLTIRLAISGTRIYAAFKSKTTFMVYRTDGPACTVGDFAERSWTQGWTVGSDVAPSLWSYLYAHPSDPDIVYATGTRFWRSTDGGTTFTTSDGPHVDHHAFAVDPEDDDIVYTGSDGGLYRSDDRGATDSWTFVGEGMANTEFYDIGQSVTDPDLVIGGTQDNGTLLVREPGTVWQHIRGGDGATVEVDPRNSRRLYSMNQYAASIARRESGGSWEGLDENLPDGSTCFNLHYHVHPGIPTTLLASCGSLWRTTTNVPPGDWRTIFPPADFPSINGSVVRSAVDSATNIYYAATSGGEVYAGIDGDDWELVFSVGGDCGASGGIVDIEVDQDEPGVVYVATSANTACRLIRLRRAGAALGMVAQDITSDLPADMRVTAVALDRVHPSTLYAGTADRAVYRGRPRRLARGWTWSRYSTGLPFATAITELLVHPTTGLVRAGTCGRGAYELYSEPPVGSVVAIDGTPIHLRVHDSGGYGPPDDPIEGEVIVRLDSAPYRAFGFELRSEPGEAEHMGMLDVLRSAFIGHERVRVDYVRTGPRNGRMFRVARIA